MCGDDVIAGVSLVQSAQDAVLSLFLINPIEKGGFDFDQTDIGWLFAGIGPIQIIFNHILSLRMVASFTSPLLYPLITRLYTYRGIYFVSGLIYSVFLLLYPLISLSNQCNLSVTWFIILVSTVSCILIRLFNFTSVNVLINNSTYADYRGRTGAGHGGDRENDRTFPRLDAVRLECVEGPTVPVQRGSDLLHILCWECSGVR